MQTEIHLEEDFVPAWQLSEGEIKFYQQEGYLLLPGLLSEQQATSLRAEVLAIMEQIGLGVSKLKQTGEYLAGSALDSLVNSAHLRGIAEQLMGGPSTLYLPFTAVKSPGGGRFHFHQDNQYTRFDGPGINLWFALCAMTPENGCLNVVPRSHLEGTLEADFSGDGDQHKKIRWEPADFLPLRMRAGDCVAFSRLTIHGSGPNMTDELRTAYAVQFHRDDVRATRGDGPALLLKEHPVYKVGPVERITVPKGSVEGH